MLNGVKMHVTSFNHAAYAFFQAKIVGGDHEGEHAMFFVDVDSPGVRVIRTPAYTHTYADHHPLGGVRGRAGARRPTWWARRATAWRSPTSGSATSG